MLVTVPSRLDEAGVEMLLGAIARRAPDVPEGLDASGLSFADPYGILLLLALGLSGPYRRGRAWGLVLPRDPAVLSYLERCGARELLERLFVVEGRPREDAPDQRRSAPEPVLLEVAIIREAADVHRAVARIKSRADLLLVSRLGYSTLAADRFTVAMAEICQNAVEHSGGPGLAAAQCYFTGGAAGPEIRIAVADAGIGVRASLAPRYAGHFAGAWDDRTAVHLAFRPGVTRCEDPGRGLGLKVVAEMVRAWGGSLRLRSGTAAYGLVRAGAARIRGERLAPFPGTQIGVTIPPATSAG